MIKNWDDLSYWDTGEFQVVQERLDDLRKAKKICNPKREDLFAALDLTPFEDVKVCLMGQDPYPNSRHATGVAFSVPSSLKVLPPTLVNILREYQDDLHLPEPKTGDLTKWGKQGVLLWNVIPSVEANRPGSHTGWCEWELLTKEIIEELDARHIVFVFLGGKAREFVKYVQPWNSSVIELSHPSPRGNLNARSPFLGSRMFSTINDKLNGQGIKPIDWKL